MQIERRIIPFEGVHLERREDGSPVIVGHAAVFGQLSEDLGGFREQIAPGAFTEALGADDVRALWNHNADIILGRNRSGTLEMSEDTRGLAIRCYPPDTQTVRDLVLVPMERGDITQMSFQFSVKPGGQDWARNDDGIMIRTLKKLRLYDVSPVTFPAYPQTDASVAKRSLDAYLEEQRAADTESWLAEQLEMRRRLDLIA